MTCRSCGTELGAETKFCHQCGNPVQSATDSLAFIVANKDAGIRHHRRIVIGAFYLVAGATILILLLHGIFSSGNIGVSGNNGVSGGGDVSDAQRAPQTKASSSTDEDTSVSNLKPSEAEEPPFAGQVVHPYALLKNPYQLRGTLVNLDLSSLPVFYNGAMVQYSGPVNPAFGARFGLMALRMDRMLDEAIALYDVIGIEAGGTAGQNLGELAVVIPESKTELDLAKGWMVEPVSPLKGKNYLGAEIQIPAVRFWRYRNQDRKATDDDAKVSSSRGFSFTKYPNGFMVNELCSEAERGLCYSFHWQPWIKDIFSKTAGEQLNALILDTGVASPGDLVISWDSEQRVVFQGSRAHESTSASAYFIISPRTGEMDIIWQREDNIKYLGPNSKLLKDANTYEWLKQIGF